MSDDSTPKNTLRLIAMPHLSCQHGRIDRDVPEGETVAGHLREIGWNPEVGHARVFIDGRLIEQAEWEYAVPTAGQSLTVRAIPMGGEGGGGGGKSAIRIVAMLGIIALSIFAPEVGLPMIAGMFSGGTFGFLMSSTAALMASAVISIGGMLALNALIPPPRPNLDALSGSVGSPTLSLTGSSNKLAPYQRIPRVYGRHRLYPALAARTFTEVVGNQQYLRMLFCVGYGPLALSDFKIGETSLSNFSNVEMEIRHGYQGDLPITLFPSSVHEDNLSILLKSSTGYVQRTTQDDAVEISVDIVFPNGLGDFRNPQKHTEAVQPYTVAVDVDYQLVGDTGWTSTTASAVAATAQTNFTGANNDMVFTARTAGADGNTIHVTFTLGFSLHVFSGQQYYNSSTYDPRSGQVSYHFKLITIVLVQGVTTANQVIAAIQAHSDANGLVTVAVAPGNSGAGVITIPVNPAPPTGDGRFIGSAVSTTVILAGGKNHVALFTVADKQQNQLRFSRRWKVPTRGQYNVRVRKTTTDATDPLIRDSVYWTAFRTISGEAPASMPGVCYIAMRIKATDQLNGVVDTFNCVAQSILPDWNGTEWHPAATNNPASIYRDVLQGSANKRPKLDSQLDLPAIQAFHERCTANGFAFNAVIDFATTVKQIRQDVLAAGRATFGLFDMKYSVVEDLIQASPVDVITPRTSSGFQWTKRFVEMPHAFKVRFVDEGNNWQQGERIVYADGYNAGNATIFEETEAGLGVTSGSQVWKMKRRELADALLRADDYTVTMDFQHLTFTRGDRVQLQHDVIMAGVKAARILSTTVDGSGNYLTISLDDVFVMDGALDYAVRIKSSTGAQGVYTIATVAGETNLCTFNVPAPSSLALAGGELVMVGLVGSETIDCIVKNVRPGPDYTAQVQLADYAPAIQSADSGTIPSYNSQLTLPALDAQTISSPIIDQVQSDENVLVRDVDGSYQIRIVLTMHFSSAYRRPVTRVQVQYRISGVDESDWAQIFAPVSGTAVTVSVLPVQEGRAYDLQVRSINDDVGVSSPWVLISGHIVIGKTTPPPDVTGLEFNSSGVTWAYPSPPIDFDGFLVRLRPGTIPLWDDAFQLNDVPTTSLSYPLVADGSVRTVMVKAVDVAGLESANAAYVVQDTSAQALRNLAYTQDEKAGGFSGTKTGCTVISTNLAANSQTNWWSNDATTWWHVDSDLWWQGSYSNMSYEFTVVPPRAWLTSIIRLEVGITSQGWSVEFHGDSITIAWSADTATFWTSDGAPYWVGSIPAYQTWLGWIEEPKCQVYTFKISAVGGQIQGVISMLRVLFDMPDLREVFPRTLCPLSCLRVALTKEFHVIKSVHATLVGSTYPATRVKVLDQLVEPGPLLQTLDDTNTAALGEIYVAVDGY